MSPVGGSVALRTVVVVGASLAGLSAVRALRDQGYDGRLLVVGSERHRPYDRPPLSKDFLTGKVQLADLALESDGEDHDVEWILGVDAVKLAPGQRRLDLSDGRSLQPDGVVLATGAQPRNLPALAGRPGVHVLRTVDDAAALRAELPGATNLVVVGAGFIGAEVAASARGLGLDVTVVEAAPTALAGPLGVEMGAVVSGLHADHGVAMLCGVGVRGLPKQGPAGRVDGLELADGRRLDADLVVVGVGARPATDWLAGSGIALADGVRCNAGGATSIPGVVAVGDCAAWFDPVLGEHSRVEHWTGALERPATAVATLLSGGTATPPVPRPPYFWSQQYEIYLQFAGHAQLADSVEVEAGSVADRSFLAVYRRAGQPVAVLGMNQMKLFTRWRRQLATAAPIAG